MSAVTSFECQHNKQFCIREYQYLKENFKLTDEFYQKNNNANTTSVSKYLQMTNHNQYRQLLIKLGNLPLHLLLSILSYLDIDTKYHISHNENIDDWTNQRFYNLVSLSVLAEKYIMGTDRSVYLNFYNELAFIKYQTNLIGEISTREPQRYFIIQKAIEELFRQIKKELKCFENSESLIEMLELQVRDPELPLPKMRKQGIGIHCNSSLQYGLVDIMFQTENNADDEFMDDYMLDFNQMLQCLQDTIRNILEERVKQAKGRKSPLSIMKQCYYHPEILTVHNYKNYTIKSIIPFNMFVYIHALLSGVAELYNEYILDQGKEFERFIEFEMRYCIYRSIVLAIQNSQLSKILYKAVQKLLEKVHKISEQNSQRQKLLILNEEESSSKIQNKQNRDQLQIQYKEAYGGLMRMPSQAQTQISQLLKYKMNGRLYIASGKIWTNQILRMRTISTIEQAPSPSKFFPSVSQEHVNTKSFLKILNRLSYMNILDKLQKEIEDNSQLSSPDKSQGTQGSPIRDEDIANIFGTVPSYEEIQSPILRYTPSISLSHASSLSQRSSSPYNSRTSFSQMLKSIGNIQQNSYYVTALMNIENKIRMQPYRFEKCRESFCTDNSSNSPDNEQQFMPQIQLSALTKLPALRTKIHLSKTSVISKFTKITQARSMSSVQQLIQSDVSIQEQILAQYNAYLMDLSVNELNVHWCGHTEQVLMGDHFNQLEQYILKYNEGFLCYLLKIGEQACKKIQIENKHTQQKSFLKGSHLINKLLKKLLQSHLQYMNTGLINKIILKKILVTANDWLFKTCLRYKVSQEQIQTINLNLEESDKIIEHYNENMWGIKRNAPSEKLKIYEERKTVRTSVQIARCHENEGTNRNDSKKGYRKRRNSEQPLAFHNKL